MALQCRKSIPILGLFDVSLHSDCIFIKPCQIELSISITMLSGTTSPIQCLFQVFFCTKSVIVEITYLTFSQGIPPALLKPNVPQSICHIVLILNIFQSTLCKYLILYKACSTHLPYIHTPNSSLSICFIVSYGFNKNPDRHDCRG